MRKFNVLGVALAVFACAATADAAIITQWNFNSNPPDANTATGTTTPSIGAGTASVVGGVVSAFGDADAFGGSSDPAVGDDSRFQATGWPAQGTGNKTAGFQYDVSTVGFKDIVVTLDDSVSINVSRYWRFQYTTDGSTWNDSTLFDLDLGAATAASWFNGLSVDLSSISAVDNNPNFGIRFLAEFAPTTSAYEQAASTNPNAAYNPAAQNRHDMVTVNGVVIPEPSALVLTALAVVGLLLAQRHPPCSAT